MKSPVKFKINTQNIAQNRERNIQFEECRINLWQKDNEPVNTIRVQITLGDVKMELLPSKGLSVGDVSINEVPILWKSPTDLHDPDTIDLTSREILINGEVKDGFTFLKTFAGGIEFYGMKNWGMPWRNPVTGELYLLHGETSNVPMDEVFGVLFEDRLEITGTIIYRNFNFAKGDKWYLCGEPTFAITHTIVIPREGHWFKSVIKATNITQNVLTPDWGYHVTLRPEKGSRLIVPSRSIEERSGNRVPDDFEFWNPAEDPLIRKEDGIIHKGLKLYSKNGKSVNKCLMLYPSGRGISVTFPPSPYFQTWFCCGGANSAEFTYAETGRPVFNRNWDAQGIEFGSSALDHNGNIDREVAYKQILSPGESFENEIIIKLLTEAQKKLLYTDIMDYNQFRSINE